MPATCAQCDVTSRGLWRRGFQEGQKWHGLLRKAAAPGSGGRSVWVARHRLWSSSLGISCVHVPTLCLFPVVWFKKHLQTYSQCRAPENYITFVKSICVPAASVNCVVQGQDSVSGSPGLGLVVSLLGKVLSCTRFLIRYPFPLYLAFYYFFLAESFLRKHGCPAAFRTVHIPTSNCIYMCIRYRQHARSRYCYHQYWEQAKCLWMKSTHCDNLIGTIYTLQLLVVF